METGKSPASRAALVYQGANGVNPKRALISGAEELTILRRESSRGNKYGWLSAT